MRLTSLAFLVAVAVGLALAGCAGVDEPVITIPAGPIPAPSGPADTVNDGTHEVLIDVKAGRYRSPGPRAAGVGMCFWYRLRGLGGTPEEIIASGTIYGPTTVTIAPGDRAFRTEFCQPWARIGDAS